MEKVSKIGGKTQVVSLISVVDRCLRGSVLYQNKLCCAVPTFKHHWDVDRMKMDHIK